MFTVEQIKTLNRFIRKHEIRSDCEEKALAYASSVGGAKFIICIKRDGKIATQAKLTSKGVRYLTGISNISCNTVRQEK